MQYDVEADWQLLNTCNFRCPYCFFGEDILGQKLKVYGEPDAWGKAFDDTGLRWLLHMTGGEPSAYPHFVELSKRLTSRHLISVNSNMTNKSWESFAREIDPARISFINAGLHLDERERKNGIDSYLRNVGLVRSAGFPVMASLVATPDALYRFEEAKALLARIDMYPVPKVMRGHVDDRSYPSSYTPAQRSLFRRYSKEAIEFYQPLLSHRNERPTIDMFGDASVLYGEPDYRGLPCSAGHRFFGIDSNGDVWRCSHTTSYGNLLKGTFVRSTGRTPCDTSYCFYFCNKYADKQPLSRIVYRTARVAAREMRNAILRHGS